MRKSSIFVLLAAMAALPACAIYREPPGAPELTLEAPELPTATTSTSVDERRWWLGFDDAVLNKLVDEALQKNLTVHTALANVNAARALRGLQRWEYLPEGGVGATVERGAIGDVSQQEVQAGISLGWEVDLFGRVRNANRIAAANTMSAEAALDAARLLVVTETTAAYFRYRAMDRKRVARLVALEQQKDIVALTRVMVEEAHVAPDRLDHALAELARNEIALLQAEEEQQVHENRLAVLLGRQAGQWRVPDDYLAQALTFRPAALHDVRALLRNRPDVRIAEQALIARQAATGIERAGYFPSLAVTGFVGFTAGSVGAIGDASSDAWSVIPALQWNVLDFGRTGRRVDAGIAREEGAAAIYEQTVLEAIEETQNALKRYGFAQRELGLRETARQHARAAATAAEARYQEGFGSYLEALLAQREAVEADIARENAIAGQRLATVNLFAAVGAAP